MHRMNHWMIAVGLLIASWAIPGCKPDSEGRPSSRAGKSAHDEHDHGDEHRHDDSRAHGRDEHGGDDHAAHAENADHGHEHDEVDLGTVTIGDTVVSVAQGHGKVTPGKESHLVVKLPYDDDGATAVRAWLGVQDRTLSFVGRGVYDAVHNDYDVHAVAPDPIPPNVMWWIEIERPDGTIAIGAIKPFMGE